jgi:putative tricarboxylic transport membrane protein
MEMFNQILFGFQVALTPVNILYCGLGALLGTLVGVLPGLGPVATMSILMPITLKISPVSAIIMFAGIYYGAQYGGSTTSILVNVPGEATSVVTCIDGYKMALQGRAGPALGIAAIGSFIGGTISLLGVMFLAAPLAQFALRFGPPEYFALIFLALTIVSGLAMGSTIKALIMACLGMLVGVIGMDMNTGIPRFTFGIRTLYDGVGLVPVIMGLFGIGEILTNVEEKLEVDIFKAKIERIWPSLQDWIESRWAILRGTLIGFFLGIIPGGGALISTFASYAIEKKVSRHPEKFGHGAIEGVAGPETANNAGAQSSFVPMLALGLPSNVVIAVLIGALMIHGVQPGPLLMSEHPDIFWGVITSMYLGNVMLLVLNLPLIGLWVQLLRVPYALLFPAIFLFCLVGVYSIDYNVVEIFIMIFFGAIGYLMNKFGFEPAPFVMGLVLCPMMENAFRQSLAISDGNMMVFFARPLSGFFMAVGLFVLAKQAIPWIKKRGKSLGSD